MIDQILKIKSNIKESQPLIHCITNPISINDCANIVLASGAKPIMAEHPKEVENITKAAKALAVNLGNITDARRKSIMLSGKIANKNHIPSIIDIVGVGCSELRLKLAKKYIKKNKPRVIKGNMSEIKTLCNIHSQSHGIDVGKQDEISRDSLETNVKIVQQLSSSTGSIVVATGAMDIISDGVRNYIVSNGVEMMSHLTGTGCMLNVLIASYISTGDMIGGALLGVVSMGICGELSQNEKGIGSFRAAILDNLDHLTQEQILQNIKLEKWPSSN